MRLHCIERPGQPDWGTHNLSACDSGNFDVAGNNSNLTADIEGTAGPGAILQSAVGKPSGALVNYYVDWSAATWCSYSATDKHRVLRRPVRHVHADRGPAARLKWPAAQLRQGPQVSPLQHFLR